MYLVQRPQFIQVSILALREKGDLIRRAIVSPSAVSILALREKGDHVPTCWNPFPSRFQSSPFVRRATVIATSLYQIPKCFNPRPS